MMIHEMNEARRGAFHLMRRQCRRISTDAPLMHTYFRADVMNSGMARNLAALGWLTILPGRRGRPSQIHLTDVGMWILGGES